LSKLFWFKIILSTTLFLNGCKDIETVEESESFLDLIVNQWWTLQTIDDNFYLYRENDEDLDGILYMDYIDGPTENLESNVYEGTWSYYGWGSFYILDKDGTDYELNSKKEKELNDCYEVKYNPNVIIVYTDIACPYIKE
jgi:hypothetical protein